MAEGCVASHGAGRGTGSERVLADIRARALCDTSTAAHEAHPNRAKSAHPTRLYSKALPARQRSDPPAALKPRAISSDYFLCNVSLPARRAPEALIYDVRALRLQIEPRRTKSPPAILSV
jgi:hypothetical protein